MVTLSVKSYRIGYGMHKRLKDILSHKRLEVQKLKQSGIMVSGSSDIPKVRNFKEAVSAPGKVNLIAEIKFASPSAGRIRKAKDPIELARVYEENGASAISLVTERRFFDGDIGQLPLIKKAVGVPVLRKDFIIDEIQVTESLLYGADAILLIARILGEERLRSLFEMSKDLGLSALVEVHDEVDLEQALNCGAELIGINNRDLDTFKVDLNTTIRLATLVPEHCTVVSESGINNTEDVKRVLDAGVNAILVGTAIMKAKDVAEKVRELMTAGGYDGGKG